MFQFIHKFISHIFSYDKEKKDNTIDLIIPDIGNEEKDIDNEEKDIDNEEKYKDNEIDFSIIKDAMFITAISEAYNAVFKVKGGYDYVKNKSSREPWMYNSNPIVTQIQDAMDTSHHSGASLALTFRQVEYIIKHGKDEWYKFNT